MHWLLIVVGALMIIGGIAQAANARKRAWDRVASDPVFSRFEFRTVSVSDETTKEIRNGQRVAWAGLGITLVGVLIWILVPNAPARTTASVESEEQPRGWSVEEQIRYAQEQDREDAVLPPPPPLTVADSSAAPSLPEGYGVLRVADVMPELSNPQRVRQVLARSYPDGLRGTGVEGRVIVEGIVDTLGRVVNAHVVESADPRLGVAALKALPDFEYRPGRVGYSKVPVVIVILIRFESDTAVLLDGGSL